MTEAERRARGRAQSAGHARAKRAREARA